MTMTRSGLRNGARPGRVARSAWYSLRHARPQFWRMPIVAAWSARIERHPAATLHVDGRLVLGYDAYPPRHGISRRSHHGPLIWLLDRDCRIDIRGRVVLAQGVQIAVGDSGRVAIDDGTYLNQDSRVLALSEVRIGRDCAISWDVQIMDFDGHEIRVDGREHPGTAPVTIRDHVLVGSRATILKGVEIGEGAVVAAGAVVTRSVPAAALVAGNPARVVRSNVVWR